MLKIAIVASIIFLLAIVMTMTGRGGGNFYVLTLVLAGMTMHTAAATGQFVLVATALGAALLFHKHKVMVWPLVVLIGGLTAIAAFCGGFVAQLFTGVVLKYVFSLLLAVAGILMFFKVEEPTDTAPRHFGYWHLRTSDGTYILNLWLVVPTTLVTGFCAGMVGVSGGSFLVPLMVLACRVPMRTAVGTASAMVAATALAGFIGHAVHGNFSPSWAIPVAAMAVVGGIIGGKIALKSKPKYLKALFAVTTLAAAVMMMINAMVAT